jgi:predicted 2-oxoglutarate/Fe(II)-dependent dioxygenase YbiX
MKPTKIEAGCIAIWENIFSEPTSVISMVKEFDDNPNKIKQFVKAYTADGNQQTRTNYAIDLNEIAESDNSMKLLYDLFCNQLLSSIVWYKQNFEIEEQIQINESLNLLRYQGGQEYKAHYDGGTKSKRAVSPILYINDDYEGGEIEFVNFNIKIKPKAGTFILFPSNYAYRHIAHPVKTGTKYAIVTFLHDCV